MTDNRPYEVEIEREGVTYKGTYIIAKGMIKVLYGGRYKETHLGGMEHHLLASLILSELISKVAAEK